LLLLNILASMLVSCGGGPPSLPADDSAASVHDLLTGTGGQDFLYEVSTFHWDDAGAQAGKLFEWIAAEATSPDPAVAARAGESAHALASFLANRGEGLLGIKSGVFGLTRSTVGALNPNLVRAYGTALTPYQGAMVCDTRTVNGFGALAEPCEAAVSAAKPVFAALNTDPGTASAFTDAAYARMDRYLELFVESDPASVSNPFPSALSYVGRLLGLVTTGAAHSDVTPPTIDQESTKARYMIAKALQAKDPSLRFESKFLANGVLMSPSEVRQNLGEQGLDEYTRSLANFLVNNGNIEQLISHDLKGQFDLVVAGSANGGSR
jgi:hypothetical protein